MAQLEVTLDSATPGLADALRQLEGEARQLILKDWGEYLLRSTRERAARSVTRLDSDGARLSQATNAGSRRSAPACRF
jgi:hypothetical protein